MLIQGDSPEDLIKKILSMTKGAGFIDIFEVKEDEQEIQDYKRIYVEEELYFAYK